MTSLARMHRNMPWILATLALLIGVFLAACALDLNVLGWHARVWPWLGFTMVGLGNLCGLAALLWGIATGLSRDDQK